MFRPAIALSPPDADALRILGHEHQLFEGWDCLVLLPLVAAVVLLGGLAQDLDDDAVVIAVGVRLAVELGVLVREAVEDEGRIVGRQRQPDDRRRTRSWRTWWSCRDRCVSW